MVKVNYYRTAYVSVDDQEILDELRQVAWADGQTTICQTAYGLENLAEDGDCSNKFSTFLKELLGIFKETNFDGDVIFDLEV